ncbi:flavin-containing monooxygenase [Actinophytocola oryzae]|uniref:Cation diffusion facilitator CzcD-associated flavoprotein CzcO n=1 Tax=Actinophytocola oryzae TaxID=502181 RepID=A0A4R7VS51_9PSEU|nr:NAD(P)/FAD-dependent oxidoreductase [Actinophytocola oryzae]TDV52189.1 cation diffusion facilitator CzcD-associated flavoprotein CzcO [Actinophytocola oryzae]
MPSVLIVGAGFGGIAAAVELRRAGLTDVTVLERSSTLGGVWRDNTYPGAGCDIPSPYYSFSFEPNDAWPLRFSLGPEIMTYLARTAKKYGVAPRYGVTVTGAEFRAGQWHVSTSQGSHVADVLVPAVGQLSEPHLPTLPGTFEGPAFHSARWDHSVPLTGRRVAVIGTGASAAQFVPHVVRQAAEVTVFQRSAPYVLPKPDVEYRRWQHHMFPLERALFWGVGEVAALGIQGNRPVAKAVAALARHHLRRQVADPRLRRALTPDYPIGCKRVLFANDYYPALTQAHVRLSTDGIATLTPKGVRTRAGTEHEADVLIYGTGFRTTDFLSTLTVRGREADLSQTWSDGATAYLGMTVPGFPNMFLMYGPNTNLGSGSIVYMLERQARYLRQAVALLAEGKSTLDVRPEMATAFDREMRQRLADSAWAGCRSWYRTESGRVTNNWPGMVSEYDRRTRTLSPSDYVVTS